MKFVHLADLHFGKKVFGYDLIQEQKEALQQVLFLLDSQEMDGVWICGDVYDTAIPSVDAVQLLDWFLNELHTRGVPVFMISGNHDSPGRLQFAARLLDASNIHIVSVYDGTIPFYDLSKGDQTVRIHMLPFIKPIKVKATLKEDPEGDWTKAVELALHQANRLENGHNVLLSHQFYMGGQAAESEELSIGSLDQVSTRVLDGFDYVALGHLHNPQSVGGQPHYRYCGTLLKFSASELKVQKSITVVSLDQEVTIEAIPLKPKHDLVHIQGTFDQLVAKSFVQRQNKDNYFYITLDDEQEVFQAFEKLSLHYPKILKIEYAKKISVEPEVQQEIITDSEMKHPEEIFAKFYAMQNQGASLDPTLQEALAQLWNEIKDNPEQERIAEENYEAN